MYVHTVNSVDKIIILYCREVRIDIYIKLPLLEIKRTLYDE